MGVLQLKLLKQLVVIIETAFTKLPYYILVYQADEVIYVIKLQGRVVLSLSFAVMERYGQLSDNTREVAVMGWMKQIKVIIDGLQVLSLVHNIDVDVDNRNESFSSVDVEAVSLKFDAQLSVGVIL